MCGRYSFFDTAKMYKRFKLSNQLDDIRPSYNIAPGATVPVVISQSPNQAVLMRWGLIPSWAEEPSIGYKLINARAETIDKKPSYMKPFKIRRCIVPANGFFEWQPENGKTPYYIKDKRDRLLGFAGIYSHWHKKDQQITSFSIITTKAHAKIHAIHPRMPVMLQAQNESTWLDTSIQDSQMLKKAMQPVPEDTIQIYEVSKKVNRPANNDPSVIQPVVK